MPSVNYQTSLVLNWKRRQIVIYPSSMGNVYRQLTKLIVCIHGLEKSVQYIQVVKLEIYPSSSMRKSHFFCNLKNREHMGMLAVKYACRVSNLSHKIFMFVWIWKLFPQHLVVKLSVSCSVYSLEQFLLPNSL